MMVIFLNLVFVSVIKESDEDPDKDSASILTGVVGIVIFNFLLFFLHRFLVQHDAPRA